MILYLEMLITFFKIGLVSFGGGYAMIPIIQGEVEAHHWLDTNQLTDIIAVSAMAPGPIAANGATIVGYKLSGMLGATVACIGVTLPSVLLILIVGKLYIKYQEHPLVKAIFYGIRPTIISIIAFAAVKFAMGNGIIRGSNFIDIKSTILMVAAFVILVKTKFHPAYLILASGLIGVVSF
jgi:chromate transporter